MLMAWTTADPVATFRERSKRIVRKRQHHQCAVYDASVCEGSIDQFGHVINLKSIGMARNDPHASDPALLQGLCLPCHKAKIQHEAQAGKRAKRFRPPLPHPGLVNKKDHDG